jgi:hypothetical protein
VILLKLLSSRHFWFVAAFSFIGAIAGASTFNVVTDFSDTSNPNGVWSYYYNGTAYSSSQSDPNCLHAGTLCWYNGQAIPTAIVIGQNNTGSTVSSGTITVPNGYVFMDPESEYATILFTAPAAGTYAISGKFLGADTSENSHPVQILNNGSPVFTSTISTFGGIAPFNFSESLTAGDHIAFEVNTGSTGCTYCNLSTALQATITSSLPNPVPEPASLFPCMAAGLIMLLRALRR